jgi:AcrR family transcriptional regulator
MPRAAGSTAGQTRARILEVALELVTERGYAGMSIRDLAERLDLTTAAMYYHFASKEALLDALVAPLQSELEELSAAAGSGSMTDAEVLTGLVTLLSGPGARALPVLMSDPSASRQLKTRLEPLRAFEAIVAGLAHSPTAHDLLRARCAVSVVQGAVVTCAHSSRRRGAPWPGFDLPEREVVVGAALAALHSDQSDAHGRQP